MTRTVLAALAVLRLSGLGVEPLLNSKEIHLTHGEPHRVGPIDARPASLRVVSWNIERGAQYDAIVDVLRSLDADVLLLQEVDRYCRRSGYRDVARDLAHDLGMNWVFAGEFQELGEGRRRQPATTGQAILSRYPIHDAHAAKFRAQNRWRWSFNPLQPRRGGRIVLTGQVADLRVYNTHAESGRNEGLRARQLMEILEAERGQDNLEALIAGDLNTSFASGDMMRRFEHAEFATAAHADMSGKPTSHGRSDPIDWVLAKGISIREAEILDTPWSVSDHRPIVASLDRIGSDLAAPRLASSPFDLDPVLASGAAASP